MNQNPTLAQNWEIDSYLLMGRLTNQNSLFEW